jgi:hypothetical protein
MLRLVFVVLLVLNGLFFGWVRGWFSPVVSSPEQAEREPQRLQNQVNPGRISLMSAAALNAGAAVTAAQQAAALQCLEAGPFSPAVWPAAEAAMTRAAFPAGSWSRESAGGPVWLVFGGRFVEPAARSARASEFKRLDINFEIVDSPPELAPGFVLSRHPSRIAAESALAAVLAAGVGTPRDLRAMPLPTPAGSSWVRVAKADPSMRSQLQALGAVNTAMGFGFRACAEGGAQLSR